MLPLPLAEIVDEKLDLNGIWCGDYGPHGEEAVSIQHTGEAVVATKVTGDPHVPAGEVTFRASLRGWGGPGEGQVADSGHRNARFIPGFFAVLGRDRVAFEWTGLGRIAFRRVRRGGAAQAPSVH